MIRVHDTIDFSTEYFDTWLDAEMFVKDKCHTYNEGFEPEEHITELDFNIEEHFKCGYCGQELEEDSRYCSYSCNKANSL